LNSLTTFTRKYVILQNDSSLLNYTESDENDEREDDQNGGNVESHLPEHEVIRHFFKFRLMSQSAK
jgi:hypothetical protein